MKKKLFSGIAALTMSLSVLTGCSDKSSAETPDSAGEVVITEATGVTTDTAAVTTEATVDTELTMDPAFDEIMQGMLHSIAVPEFQMNDAAVRADFNGKWECDVISDGESAYDSMFGIPVGVMMHLEITADKDEIAMISVDAPDDGEQAEEENETAAFVYEAGRLTITTPPEDDKEGEIPGAYDTVTYIVLNSDGRLVMYNKDEADGKYYFRRVDSYTEFDWSTYQNPFSSMFEIEDGDASDTTTVPDETGTAADGTDAGTDAAVIE